MKKVEDKEPGAYLLFALFAARFKQYLNQLECALHDGSMAGKGTEKHVVACGL